MYQDRNLRIINDYNVTIKNLKPIIKRLGLS